MKEQSLKALGAIPLTLEEADDLLGPGGVYYSGLVEKYRQAIPEAISGVTQIIVDNPGQMALTFAGMVVISRAAYNVVKPKTALQTLALAVVLQVGLPALATKAVEHGWLRFKVRDADGCLVPLEIGGDRGPDRDRPAGRD